MCDCVDSYKPTDVIHFWFPQTCSKFCWWWFQNGPVLDNTLKEKVFFFTSEEDEKNWEPVRQRGRVKIGHFWDEDREAQMEMVLTGTRQIDGSRDSKTFRLCHQNVIKLYIIFWFFFLIARALLLVVSKLSVRQKSKFWKKAVSSASSLQVWGVETLFFIILFNFFYSCGTSSLK